MNRRGAIVAMLVFVALWATVEALAGAVLVRYSPYQVVFTRYVVHLALMATVWGTRDPSSLWRTRRPVFQLARSLLMLGMPAAWVLSTQLGVDGRTLMSVFWLSPLLVLAFAGAFLREHASPLAWIAALVAGAGMRLAVGFGGWPPGARLAFPLAMALTFSVYVVMTRSLRSETTRANLFYTALGVAVALAPIVPRLWITPTPHDLVVMIGVGVLGFATLFALDRAAEIAPLAVSAPFLYFQWPIFVAVQWALGGGRPGARGLAGSALIAAGGLIAWWIAAVGPRAEVTTAAVADRAD